MLSVGYCREKVGGGERRVEGEERWERKGKRSGCAVGSGRLRMGMTPG